MESENRSRAKNGTLRILLQTTIPDIEDNWNIGRFSMLRDYLLSLKNSEIYSLFDVVARDYQREQDGSDAVLRHLDESDFDELWLFAVDVDSNALSETDRAGI